MHSSGHPESASEQQSAGVSPSLRREPDGWGRRGDPGAWITADLAPLLAIAMATLDEGGVLVEANAGFMRVIGHAGPMPPGFPAARFFLQPSFSALSAVLADTAAIDDHGEVHRGLLTNGEYAGKTRTLRGRVWRAGTSLRVPAELDVEELEQLYDTVLELNRDYASTQAALAQANLKLQQREAQVLVLSLTDVLTGVGNRRRLEEALPLEVNRVERNGTGLCALMADLDYFKRINDGFGHEAGDKVLAAFGDLLLRQTRPTDIVARYGGEEFVILLPHTRLDYALVAAERIRAALAAAHIEPLPDGVTASFGVAELAVGEKGDALLRRIDAALYSAKQSGRNRVVAG